ncbi:MAG: type I restriction-modification system subunit M [Metamycoplasmataceae bacterium]
MENNRENNKSELYKTLWKIANDLRGSVDGWDFKNYIFGFMFYRFISENLTNFWNEKEGAPFDYASLSDEEVPIAIREYSIDYKGFWIKPSELFQNVLKGVKRDNLDNLNETLSQIFKNIESSSIGSYSEKAFKGLFADIDVNSNKLGNSISQRNKRLFEIMDAIGNFKLGNYHDNSIDVFGDAYEYLMVMYASNAGKSGGEFFTPQEVSELLTHITIIGKTKIDKVYDPAAGSGSLLLKFGKILGINNVEGFYGQEINITTYNLARMNMFLHNIPFTKFDIENDDTLIVPKHLDEKPFEAIVSNPPYSINWEGDSNPTLINDSRFSPAGVLSPKSKADFAFIMHSLDHLASNGVAAIVCFPGIFYRSGAEQKIRKYLIDNNYIDAIIQLPDNLFFGTSISTNILVLKKSRSINEVLFIDASQQFMKVNNGNKLTQNNIYFILDLVKERKELNHISKNISKEEISKSNYDLSVNSYIEKEDTSEVINIIELEKEIEEIVTKNNQLRKEINDIIREIK